MFEKASRNKLRFGTPAGVLNVEDLWDLPLMSKAGHTNLDDIARDLNSRISENEESFVEKSKRKDPTNQLAFEIVKHVIEVRLEEREAAKGALAKKEQKAKILAIMSSKQDKELEETSLEDLQKMLEDL